MGYIIGHSRKLISRINLSSVNTVNACLTRTQTELEPGHRLVLHCKTFVIIYTYSFFSTGDSDDENMVP